MQDLGAASRCGGARSTCGGGVRGPELAVRRVVAQRHAAQLHVPVARRQLARVRRYGHARPSVEHLEDARTGRGRALGEAERHAERAHRPDEHVEIEVERGEFADREVAVDDLVAADQQHGGKPELGQKADHRVELRLDARRDHRLLEDASNCARKAIELERLAREGLDDADARDVLLGVCGELCDSLLHLLDGGPGGAAIALGDQHDERHRRE